MTKKTFLEKYPEFKDLFRKTIMSATLKSKLRIGFKEILDNHFERKTECERLMRLVEQFTGKNFNELIEQEMIHKQKVKDAMHWLRGLPEYAEKGFIKELGLEDD